MSNENYFKILSIIAFSVLCAFAMVTYINRGMDDAFPNLVLFVFSVITGGIGVWLGRKTNHKQ